MKPEVQAAIESRRQWFWVWTLGLCNGLGSAIAFHAFPTGGKGLLLLTPFFLLAIYGLWLYVATLRIQKNLLAWTALIAATTALTLSTLISFVNSGLMS